MNKYLLLRDNKQSGPYTVEELVKKGIKPYDLVWLEGRSAAWRYPSEMDDLKQFAPAVEEQPYDRFYKRSSSAQDHAIHAAQQQLSKQEELLPVVENFSTAINAQSTTVVQNVVESTVAAATDDSSKEVVNNIPLSQPIIKTGTGKVYVTLPAGFRQQPKTVAANATQQSGTAADEKNVSIKQATTIAATPSNPDKSEKEIQEDAGVSREAAEALEARAAALAQSIQAAAAEAAAKKQTVKQSVDHAAYLPKEQTSPNFSSLISTKQATETIPVIPMRNQNTRRHRMLMRGVVAACFLLGGIVIGIALTYSKGHQSNQEALDQLVQRLQEREAQKQNGIQPELPNTDASGTPANAINYAEETPAPTEDDHPHSRVPADAVDNPRQQLAVKEKAEVPVTNNNAPITYQEKDLSAMKVSSAVVTHKEEARPVSEADISKAREKIYQNVQVAASPFHTGVLGGISNLYFTVSNSSSFPLDMIELEIKYLGPEKRVVKVQRLLFNDVAAGGQKTLEAPRTSRGVSIDYGVTKINSRALGIAHAGF